MMLSPQSVVVNAQLNVDLLTDPRPNRRTPLPKPVTETKQ